MPIVHWSKRARAFRCTSKRLIGWKGAGNSTQLTEGVQSTLATTVLPFPAVDLSEATRIQSLVLSAPHRRAGRFVFPFQLGLQKSLTIMVKARCRNSRFRYRQTLQKKKKKKTEEDRIRRRRRRRRRQKTQKKSAEGKKKPMHLLTNVPVVPLPGVSRCQRR